MHVLKHNIIYFSMEEEQVLITILQKMHKLHTHTPTSEIKIIYLFICLFLFLNSCNGLGSQ